MISNTMICDDDDVGEIDFSKWRKLYSREFGISNSMIPAYAWNVLKGLQSGGDTYIRCFAVYPDFSVKDSHYLSSQYIIVCLHEESQNKILV